MTGRARSDAGGPDPASAAAGGRVSVIVEDEAWLRSCPDIVAVCAAAARAALAEPAADGRRGGGEVAVLLADDDHVHRLNRAWRGIDRATNVLAFEAGPAPNSGLTPALGDIILGFGTVGRECRASGRRLRDHAQHLVIHGCLHLLGYRHDGDREADVMEAVETALLATLGVSDPYAGNGVADAESGS